MSFGLCNAPATFQRLMNSIFREVLFTMLLCYLHDILIYGSTVAETLERLEVTLSKSKDNGLKLQLNKCSFFQKEVIYLGHRISEAGIGTDPAKIEAVTNWPRPTTLKELRSYLGFCSYYHRYVPHFIK